MTGGKGVVVVMIEGSVVGSVVVVVVVVVDDVDVFTVASVNIIQSKLTIRSINNIMVVITRIKLVTSRLPLKLKITLVVMVSRFYWQW